MVSVVDVFSQPLTSALDVANAVAHNMGEAER